MTTTAQSLAARIQDERARIANIAQWLRDHGARSADCSFELLGAVTVFADGSFQEAGWAPEQQAA